MSKCCICRIDIIGKCLICGDCFTKWPKGLTFAEYSNREHKIKPIPYPMGHKTRDDYPKCK